MAVATRAPEVAVEGLRTAAYEIPTDEPESDGTLEWSSTTIVVVEVAAGDETGVGYTYGDASVGRLIDSLLAEVVRGADALTPGGAWRAMRAALRNTGAVGPGAMALSAVDIALWDLRARILGVPLADALPRVHGEVPVYGSGGFCSYSLPRLATQLAAWVERGIPRVKMKIGRDPGADPARLDAARQAIGDATELFTDANGAYGPAEALDWAARLREDWDVTYLEEPVTSDDPQGLRRVRDGAPPGLEIAAGEYAWGVDDVSRLLAAGAVDVIQADVTRCGGITALLGIDGVARSHHVPFSAHCAPSVSAHACAAMESLAHLELFWDHTRVESLVFDGVLPPDGGHLRPDRSRPGLGLEVRRTDIERYEV